VRNDFALVQDQALPELYRMPTENTVRLTHVEWNDLVARIKRGGLPEII
jgi:hypothetical protein